MRNDTLTQSALVVPMISYSVSREKEKIRGPLWLRSFVSMIIMILFDFFLIIEGILLL